MSADPVDVLTWAAESSSRDDRVRGYREALALTSAPSAFDAAYLASARARALSGLARDGEAAIEDAADAVDRAVQLGAPCAALAALAETAFSLGRYEDARTAIQRLPKNCFRSSLLFAWRFRLWNLRARASFELGRVGEGLRYAERIASKMAIAGDPLELAWFPPRETVEVLLTLADEADREAGSERARAILRAISTAVDTEDWFGPEMACAIDRVALRRRRAGGER